MTAKLIFWVERHGYIASVPLGIDDLLDDDRWIKLTDELRKQIITLTRECDQGHEKDNPPK